MTKNMLIPALTALTALLLSATSCTDRNTLLKVYNWGDYIDETALAEFEAWYEEQTGEKVQVIYQTFDINETMLSRIEKGQEDYDVVCPSDYIIERMMQQELLLPISRDFGQTPNYIDETLSPFIVSSFDQVDCGDMRALDYAVPYMWGTTGILYNAKYVTDEEASTWNIVTNEKFANRLFMKDAARDVYSALLFYLKREELAAGLTTPEALMFDYSDSTMALLEDYMTRVTPLVAGWEADFGKEQMTQEKGYVNLTWSGDAMWAAVEGAEVGVDLRYRIPVEGSNVWFDGWVIPKYAQNVKAARYFINFLSRPDIVVRNMDVTGYVSAMASPEILEAMTDSTLNYTVNAAYFFGPEAREAKVNAIFYPDSADIARCVLMHDWGEETQRLTELWVRIKGDNASSRTYVLIGLIVVVIVAVPFLSKGRRKKHGTKKKSSRR